MNDAERLAVIRRAAQGELATMKEFPVRIDAMTANEGAIADIACKLCGTLKFILTMTDPEPSLGLAPGEPRDWLILSLKWSRGCENLMWFKPEACGYTPDLEKAGRFTHEEAQRRTRGDEKINAMVPVAQAYAVADRPALVEAGEAMVERLTETTPEK